MSGDWVAALEPGAPDVIVAWRGIDEGAFLSVRREVRRRAGTGTTEGLVAQLDVLATALIAIIRELPEDAFGLPGGEEDWTVAETIGHAAAARSGLVLAAGLAAADRWPDDAPIVVPGVPGPASLDRADLVHRLEQSQRIVARSTGLVAGAELAPCPLEHPLVGRLRCGEWVLFAGVHDVMHLEQLHRIEAELAGTAPG
jgi:hypothetical protein